MFYYALGAIPSWAPAGESHILYSSGVLRDVVYTDTGITYNAVEKTGTEYLRVSFKPSVYAKSASVKVEPIGKGDYYVVIDRRNAGAIRVVNARK